MITKDGQKRVLKVESLLNEKMFCFSKHVYNNFNNKCSNYIKLTVYTEAHELVVVVYLIYVCEKYPKV